MKTTEFIGKHYNGKPVNYKKNRKSLPTKSNHKHIYAECLALTPWLDRKGGTYEKCLRCIYCEKCGKIKTFILGETEPVLGGRRLLLLSVQEMKTKFPTLPLIQIDNLIKAKYLDLTQLIYRNKEDI